MMVLMPIIAYFAVAGLVAAVLAWRHRLKAPTLARPARRPGAAVRLAEGLALAMVGAAILVMFIGAGPIPWSDLGLVKAHLPELYKAWTIALALAAAGLALVLATAALWRTWAAALLMVGWLVGVLWLLAGGGNSLAVFMKSPPDEIITFSTLAPHPDFPHVQLYVNGVHLGEPPVTMTMKEFLAKVPYWPEPPEGLTENQLLSSEEQKTARPWFYFTAFIPKPDRPWDTEQRRYYAQAELDGEWGGGFGGGGGGGGGRIRSYESFLSFRFPKFDARVQRHIEQAAQAGFRVDAAWMAEAETFGNRTWQLLRERIAKNPPYQQILDQWAALHYRLPKPMSADDAREALERIAAEAEELGKYDTLSVAGAATDLVVPHLDVGWLVRAANDALRSNYGGYGYSSSGGGFSVHGSGQRSLRDYVLAHAVWRMDQRLDAQDDSQPNRIETEVLPTLVYCSRDDSRINLALDLAVRLGWPGAFDFIYRHNWSRSVSEPFDDDAIRVGQDQYVNGWLYRLLNFDGPEARAFRNRYTYLAFDMADKATRGADATVEMDHLGFLFMDRDLGAESLAVKFWPRFLEATRAIQPDNGYWGLLNRIEYLARTEPNATLQMYREALAVTHGQLGWIPTDKLERLPPSRQVEIIDLWTDQLREIAANPPKDRRPWMEPQSLDGPDELLRRLELRRKELAGR